MDTDGHGFEMAGTCIGCRLSVFIRVYPWLRVLVAAMPRCVSALTKTAVERFGRERPTSGLEALCGVALRLVKRYSFDMKIRLLMALVLFMCVLAVVAQTVAPKPEVAAQAVAEKWLALVDEQKYADSWSQLAPSFKKEVSQRKWKSSMGEIRKPLGKLVSRKLKSAEFTKELPGAPEGEYVVLKFESVFENKTNVVETVTPMRDSDLVWRVAGYMVK
jgi:hypothetical protein